MLGMAGTIRPRPHPFVRKHLRLTLVLTSLLIIESGIGILLSTHVVRLEAVIEIPFLSLGIIIGIVYLL